MRRQPGAADLVLVGGSVVTMDAARTAAAAVAIRDGRIVASGTDHDIADLVGPRTRRIDLAGRTVLPGFQDAHCHPSMAGLNLTRCPLHELPARPEAYLSAIEAYASANPDRPWVARRWLVHVRVSRRDADAGRARPGRAGSPGVLRQPRRPRRVGQQPRACGRRHHPRHDGPGGRPDRARRDRGAERDPPRRGDGARPTAHPSPDRRGGRRRAGGSPRRTCTGSASPPGRMPGSRRRTWRRTGSWPSAAA